MFERVTCCEDNKYRWVYVLSAWKNPAVFRTVAIVCAIAYFAPLIILIGIFTANGQLASAMKEILPIYMIIGLVLIVIVIVCYYAVGKYYGGKFTFLYEMDENGITFRRFEGDEEKTQNIADLAVFTGLLTKNAGLVGAGMSTSINDTAYSNFSKIYTISADEKTDMIALTSFLLYNQIFVPKEDFEFVLSFIESHSGKTAKR